MIDKSLGLCLIGIRLSHLSTQDILEVLYNIWGKYSLFAMGFLMPIAFLMGGIIHYED